MLQARRSDSIFLQRASAIGLRQVLPVQTNRRIVPDMRSRACSSRAPGRATLQESPSTRTTVDREASATGPSSRIIPSPSIASSPLAVADGGSPSRCAPVRATGPGRRRRISRVRGCAGTRSAIVPSGAIASRTVGGRRRARPSATPPSTIRVKGPGHPRRASFRATSEAEGAQSGSSSASRRARGRGRGASPSPALIWSRPAMADPSSARAASW